MVDVAAALIGDRKIEVKVTGIRPGEKVDEILVSEEEAHRTVARGKYYSILPILPELRSETKEVAALEAEYSSGADLLNREGVAALIVKHKLTVADQPAYEEDMLR
jgi:UDP-glucose 4-epimerase